MRKAKKRLYLFTLIPLYKVSTTVTLKLGKLCTILFILCAFFNHIALAEDVTFSSTLDTVAPLAVPGIISTSTGIQKGRKAKNGDVGNCDSLVSFSINSSGNSFRYDSYSFRTTVAGCVSVKFTSTNLEPVVYSTSFDPINVSVNFVSYGGNSGNEVFSFYANANQNYILVANEVSSNGGIGTSYSVTLSGITPGPMVTGSSTVCSAANSTVLSLIHVTDPVVRWELSENSGATWETIADTNYTYTATDLQQTTLFRAVTHPLVGNDTASFFATVTVKTSPVITLDSFRDICTSTPIFALTGGLPVGGTYSGDGVTSGSGSIDQDVCIYSYSGDCTFSDDMCSDGDSIVVSKTLFSSLPENINGAKLINGIKFKLYYSVFFGIGQGFTFYLNGDSIGFYANTDGVNSCNPTNYPVVVNVTNHDINSSWIFDGNNIISIRATDQMQLAGYVATINYSNLAYDPVVAGAGIHTVTYSFTAENGCSNTSATRLIKIGPPVLSSISDIEGCSGDTIVVPDFVSSIDSTSFSWVNDNIAIGLPSDGKGNINRFKAPENNSDTDIVASISVLPYLGCEGSPVNFKITVHPKPIGVASPSTQQIYTGTAIQDIVLTVQNNLAHCYFTWTRDSNTEVTGIAAYGSGNISGILMNTTKRIIPVTFSITPSDSNGCSGKPFTAVVEVYPSTIGGSVTGGSEVCHGSDAWNLTLRNFSGNIIKWQSSVSPFTSWTDIVNTDSVYSPGKITETTWFRAVVQKSAYEISESYPAIVVDDSTAPSITCLATQTKYPDEGGYTYTVQGTEFDVEASDNCSVASLVHNYNGGGYSLDGLVFNPDTTLVIWTATDGHGNTSSCNFEVIVKRSLSVSLAYLTMNSADGSTSSFDISSNTNWSLTSSDSWLTANLNFGTDDGTIVLTATANPTTTSRTATITVIGNGVSSQNITVTQEGLDPVLSVSVISLDVGASEGLSPVFIIFSNTGWSISSSDDWLTTDLLAGSGNDTVTVTAAVNSFATNRNGTLTVSAPAVSSQVVTITQAAATAYLSVLPVLMNLDASASSNITVDVTSNEGWSVVSSASWLSTGSTSGSGNSTINLVASANTSASSRTAILTFSGLGVSDQTVTVVQASQSDVVVTHTNSVLNIYPDPVVSSLYISGLDETSTISIYNMIGKLVLKKLQVESLVDVSSLKPGVYMLKIENKSWKVARRFVKQ
jgi:hypothetical protein